MNIITISTFDHYYCNEVVHRLSKIGIYVKAMVTKGTKANQKSRQIHWAYTNNHHGLHLSDLAELNIPLFIVQNFHDVSTLELIKSLEPDIIIQGGSGILKNEIITIPSVGVINSHPGKLPEYRGCNSVEWAIYNDEKLSSTSHFIDSGIDTGPIIECIGLDTTGIRDYSEIRLKAFFHEADVHVRAIKLLLDGFTIHDAIQQASGHYHEVMPADKLAVVKSKIIEGNYRFA